MDRNPCGFIVETKPSVDTGAKTGPAHGPERVGHLELDALASYLNSRRSQPSV